MHKIRYLIAATTAVVLLVTFRTWSSTSTVPISQDDFRPTRPHSPLDTSSAAKSYADTTSRVADYFEAYPLPESEFGQMGKRLQILEDWIHTLDTASLPAEQKAEISSNIEHAALSLTPFLRSPTNSDTPNYLQSLRRSFIPGSRGIVIATGHKRFRFACHLIKNLRNVLESTLPIQIAYAGDSDLPVEHRKYLESIGPDISTFDVTSVFDDTTLKLVEGGWAIKAFALLASTFEQAMLLDADTIFLQKPENIFNDHPGYHKTGTLLFHDRLLWQYGFKERHEWWEKELAHTELSSTIKHSKVFVEKYAEEGDSGVVVVDKGRLEVFIGLLHICWQNTYAVREAFTYRQGYGDKESWWFGFELVATPYTMEDHYGAIVGHTSPSAPTKVCSFTIAHVDAKNKLLWYNGSLLKNKEISATDLDVPTEWMIDGTWEKGASKADMSCMKDTDIRKLTSLELDVLQKTVKLAEENDRVIQGQIPGSVEESKGHK
jgi:alpha 1,3-mannosyltransferase